MSKFIDFASKTAPYLIVSLVFLVTVSSIISLVLVDVITGQITGNYLSKDWEFGLFTSLAGTGMLIACGVLISSLWEKEKYMEAGAVITVFLVLQAADVYFDGISVDIKRFGSIISTTILSEPEAMAHNIYRFFVSGISFVGEPLGIASLVAFPLLKKWLEGMLSIKDSKILPRKPTYPNPYIPNMPTMNGLPRNQETRPYSPPNDRPKPRPAQRPGGDEPTYHPPIGYK